MPDEYVLHDPKTSATAWLVWNGGWPQTSQEFEEFVDLLLDRLVRYAFHRLGKLDEAEDVVQDVLVKGYADRAKLKRVRKAVPYIYRMLANACSERRARHCSKTVSLEDLRAHNAADIIPDASNGIMAFEEFYRIEQLLNRLPDDQAEVIRMRILDELPLSDIADITGCNLSTIKSRLRYGLQRLRRVVPSTKEGSI